MRMLAERLDAIREGRRGIALALYIDVADDDWEDYVESLPSVLALESDVGFEVLETLKRGLATGDVLSIGDTAAEAVRLLMATSREQQAFLRPMLEAIAGHMSGDGFVATNQAPLRSA